MKRKLKDQIEYYLEKKNINAFTLCKRAGVSPGSLSRFMNGKRSLRLDVAERLMDIVYK